VSLADNVRFLNERCGKRNQPIIAAAESSDGSIAKAKT
jgi:hypothetical protein